MRIGEEELRKSREGTKLVRNMLQEIGWKVGDLNGDGWGFPVGLPGGVEHRWVGLRTKQDKVFFKKWNRYVHGISLDAFQFYRTIALEQKVPAWLFVYEVEPNNIIAAPLSALAMPMWHRTYQGTNEQDPGGNIYFDRMAFALFAIPPKPGEMWELRDNHWLPSRYLKGSHLPPEGATR